ncbi:hypothetical protein V6N13_077353 [Hibiscus sabdariffa]
MLEISTSCRGVLVVQGEADRSFPELSLDLGSGFFSTNVANILLKRFIGVFGNWENVQENEPIVHIHAVGSFLINPSRPS